MYFHNKTFRTLALLALATAWPTSSWAQSLSYTVGHKVQSQGTNLYTFNHCDNNDGALNPVVDIIPSTFSYPLTRMVTISDPSSASLSVNKPVSSAVMTFQGGLSGCFVTREASSIGVVNLSATASADAIEIVGTKSITHEAEVTITNPGEQGADVCLQAKQRNARGTGALVPFVLSSTTPLKITSLSAVFSNVTTPANASHSGQSTLIWRIFRDDNANGTLDQGEAKVQGGQISGSLATPGSGLLPSFNLAAGSYLLTANWQSKTSVSATVSCPPGGSESAVLSFTETAGVRLEVQ